MGFFNHLFLLSWKYFCYRKYYAVMTILEIVLPAILTFIVIKISIQPEDDLVNKHVEKVIPNRTTHYQLSALVKGSNVIKNKTVLNDTFTGYTFIGYAPKRDCAEIVFGYLNDLSNFNFLWGGEKLKPITFGFENEDLLLQNITNAINSVGVIFDSCWKTFKYRIRDNHIWNTTNLYVETDNVEQAPPITEPYYKRGFVSLQHAIDTAFMKAVVKKENSSYFERHPAYRNSYYQGFPTPEYDEKDDSEERIPLIICFVIIISSLILTGPLIVAIISEKQNGLKEWMKICGLSESTLWISWFLNSMLVSLVVYSIVTTQLYLKFYNQRAPVFTNVAATLTWTCIILFFAAQISFCLLFCALFHSTAIASTALAVVTVVIALVSLKLRVWKNKILLYVVCLCPSGALTQIFMRMSYFEMLDRKLGWKNIFHKERVASVVPIGHSMIFFLFDTLFYLLLTLYISHINPGKYGYKQPWYFIIKSGSSGVVHDGKRILRVRGRPSIFEIDEDLAKKYIEDGPPGVEPSLIITNLEKRFGYVQVVRRLNLTVYSNQILVLLGHNGAGKTTALSMLTGITTATSGSIEFRNLDVLNDMKKFRKSLGTCPQEDRLLPYMTVINHLKLFGGLKGSATWKEVSDEAQEYLTLMDMFEKSDELPDALSTATKRKLCLSISLMGKSEVLILDEPTAGVDDFSKLRIWALLKKLKENRTIIVTSHVMREAGEIGDRIAILNNGGIACNGSVDFLKGAYGAGYQLKVTRKRDPAAYARGLKNPAHKLIEVITSGVPGARIESRTPTELLFHLPLGDTSKFASLFKSLESKKGSLNIARLSLSYATLDQIFMKVSGANVNNKQGKALRGAYDLEEPLALRHEKEGVTRMKMRMLQFGSMWKKKYLFMSRNNFTFICRVFVPTILMLFLVRGIEQFSLAQPPLELSLKLYSSSVALLIEDNKTNDKFIASFKRELNTMKVHYTTFKSEDIVSSLLERARSEATTYRKDYSIACNLNIDEPTKNIYTLCLYNKWLLHSFPALVNAYSNTVLKFMFDADSSVRIVAVNHPIQRVNKTLFDSANDNEFAVYVWYTLIGFFTVDLLDYFIIPIKIERADGFKHIQLMSGVSPLFYWLTTFIYDFSIYVSIVIFRILAVKVFDSYEFFSFQPHMVTIIVLLFLFLVSGLLFMYVISYLQKSKHGSYIFFLLFNLVCSVAAYQVYVIDNVNIRKNKQGKTRNNTAFNNKSKYFIKGVSLGIPPLNFLVALFKVLNKWKDNYEKIKSKKKVSLRTYIKIDNGVGLECIFLLVDIAIYSILLFIFEQGFFSTIANIKVKLADRSIRKKETSTVVPKDVADEEKKLKTPRMEIEKGVKLNRLAAINLRKVYVRLFRKPVVATKNATFVVDGGECFALLGREGAGKTTTTRLLAGDLLQTQGDAMFNDFKLSKNKAKYLSAFGYCSDANPVLEVLSGRELLEIVAGLRGIESHERESIVDKWLSVLNLETIQNKPFSKYSGGNKRKLVSVMAFIGDPHVVLLDEPVHGVDPISRKKLGYILDELKVSGQIIVFTTHSMDECEDLCDRLTVLVKGEMKFIGSVEKLRDQYIKGFSLTLKLHPQERDESDESRQLHIDVIKKKVITIFKGNANLKLEGKDSLYFLLTIKASWSDTFVKIENLKTKEKVIMDYLLTETSLDEIYLSFYEKIK